MRKGYFGWNGERRQRPVLSTLDKMKDRNVHDPMITATIKEVKEEERLEKQKESAEKE